MVDLVAAWFGSWLITLEIIVLNPYWKNEREKYFWNQDNKKSGQALLHSIELLSLELLNYLL